MAYAVILNRSAEKDLDRLPEKIHQRIIRKLLELEDNPRHMAPRSCMATMATESVSATIASCI